MEKEKPKKKRWYLSKTVWVNVLAIIIALGVDLREQDAAAILGVINILLRIITKEELTW